MQTMGDRNKLSKSDDEEDLEALRIAALQSLKKKNEELNGTVYIVPNSLGNSEQPNRYNRLKGMQNRRRFFGTPYQGRNGINCQFSNFINNRVRNTNLIAIPTIPSEDEKIENETPNESRVEINLPQDRYCSKDSKEEKAGEGTSKFNRYNNSDKSETESEEEEEGATSEEDSPGKLKKSDSLEALMQELDDEIQGKTKLKEEKPEKSKTKKTKRKKRVISETISFPEVIVNNGVEKLNSQDCNKNVEVIKHTENNTSHISVVASQEGMVDKRKEIAQKLPEKENRHRYDERDTFGPVLKRPRSRSRSPRSRRGFPNRRGPRSFQPNFLNLPINMPYLSTSTQFPPSMIPFPPNPFVGPPNLNMMHQPPPFFDRPLSPLAINTESLKTATLAPLSPRSAAFVLQNKAIIEKRKRSPRRSYSRSSSRSPRRSLTPRRSPRRSMSPRRISRSPRRLSRSPVRRRSLSPRRRSISPRRRSISPRRRSISPRRRNIGRSSNVSPKSRPLLRDRLGLVKNKSDEDKEKEKPKEPEDKPKMEEKPLDPILEARKKKFESNEIKMKEGIIRLKPKEEKIKEIPKESQETPASSNDKVAVKDEEKKSTSIEEKEKQTTSTEEKVKDAPKEWEEDPIKELERLLGGDDIILDHKADDIIFSDEDSASDNEGRFKVKQQTGEKPSVLPFTKLVDTSKKDIKPRPLPDSSKNDRDRRRDRRSSRFDSRRNRGRSPTDRKNVAKEVKDDDRKSSTNKTDSTSKSRITLKNERQTPQLDKRFDRKIEIKIKNPAKYEKGGRLKFSKDSEKAPEEVARKVELGSKDEQSEDEEEELEPEIVVENDSGDDENSNFNEGDLRAQLSKKRAEKLHRIPVEGVSSRLLQNALQGAVFKKTSRRKSKEPDLTTSDGKLPIHLRLGIANNSDIFIDTKVKRKSRKRKNREVLEQV